MRASLAFQSMTPYLACSLPRKMFSAIESIGTSASSWWMMTMPTCSLSWMPLKWHSSPRIDDLCRHSAVRIDARQHLHQGGFARAVLADDGVDLALFDAEIDVRQGLHAGEGLGDVTHLEDGGRHGRYPHLQVGARA